MKHKKKIFSALTALLTVLALLAGCSSARPSAQTTDAAGSAGSDASPAETRTVTDLTGRRVEIPAAPSRIVGLSSASRFITYAGAAEFIVGLSSLEMSGDPGIPFAYANKDRFAGCTAVSNGGSSDEFYTEEIIVLNPDLIFIYTSEAAKADELQAQLRIPVVAFYADDFRSPDFLDSLRLIGGIMGTEDHANAVCEAIEGWIADLDNRTKDIPKEEKPSVYTGAVGFRGPHGFEGTYGEYPPFMAVNAHNVVDETETGGAMLIDPEKVLVWDPDIIFLNPSNMYLVNEDYAVNPDFYESLSAVRNGRIYSQVSFNYFSTNMELAIADAYYAGCVIFPEQFADITFEEKTEEIFRLMIGTDYLDVLDAAGIGFGPLTIGENEQ